MSHAGMKSVNPVFTEVTAAEAATKKWPPQTTHTLIWNCPKCGQTNGPHLFFGVADKYYCACEHTTLIRPPAAVNHAVLH